MVFDEDSMLLGLYNRYNEEIDELKAQIVKYIAADVGNSEEELIEVSQQFHNLVVVASGQCNGREETTKDDGQPAEGVDEGFGLGHGL